MARSISDTDREVGRRIRDRRIQLGLTQQQVAETVGITYQQQYKYENGINRVSAGRLAQLAGALKVPINFLFEEQMGESTANEHERMTLDVARNFALIRSPEMRAAVASLARAAAAA